MKFEDIESALGYLVKHTENNGVEYDRDRLTKTRDLLSKFIHKPKITNPEVRSYDTDTLRSFKARHPHNKVENGKAYAMVLYDFDESIVYFVEFGDLNNDDSFIVECDVVEMEAHQIKSNAQAIELLEEYYKEVEYDEMNDSWDYHANYRAMMDRKAVRGSEIVRMFEDITV